MRGSISAGQGPALGVRSRGAVQRRDGTRERGAASSLLQVSEHNVVGGQVLGCWGVEGRGGGVGGERAKEQGSAPDFHIRVPVAAVQRRYKIFCEPFLTL